MANHVKFISYTGKYPNLCSGDLTLEIDGKIYRFKRYENRFWRSGGYVSFYDDWSADVGTGEWEIDVESLPEEIRKYADEIAEVFNANVAPGCCGGCV